jgi:hypothetical protein
MRKCDCGIEGMMLAKEEDGVAIEMGGLCPW